MPTVYHYGTSQLTISGVLDIAAGNARGILDEEAIRRINASAANVQAIVDNHKTVYGVNTGFGILASTRISDADTVTLQHKILQSHSVGVGDPIPVAVAKTMLICKVQALAQGYSGVQLSTLQRIIWHIENDVIPLVPEKGSVGASGDLAPLSHLFLPLIGLGECYYKGERKNTADIFAAEGIAPVQLGPKEGLALINGTQFILAFAIRAVQRMQNCLEAADIIGAMSLEALTGTKAPLMQDCTNCVRMRAISSWRSACACCWPIRISCKVMWIAAGYKIPTACVVCPRCTAPPVMPGNT